LYVSCGFVGKPSASPNKLIRIIPIERSAILVVAEQNQRDNLPYLGGLYGNYENTSLASSYFVGPFVPILGRDIYYRGYLDSCGCSGGGNRRR
jgi:hypothetical protein